MARVTRRSTKRRPPRRRKGDVQTLVRVENPDDMEFAAPISPGDPESLVEQNSPDDDEYATSGNADGPLASGVGRKKGKRSHQGRGQI
jgi:hypothetical protein